jgi:hypothetical protein
MREGEGSGGGGDGSGGRDDIHEVASRPAGAEGKMHDACLFQQR